METLDDGAGDGEAAELFEGFVEDVAGIKIWGNQNVGLAFQGAIRGLFFGDTRTNGGVKLDLPVDEPVWMGIFDFMDAIVVILKFGCVFGAGAVGRIR